MELELRRKNCDNLHSIHGLRLSSHQVHHWWSIRFQQRNYCQEWSRWKQTIWRENRRKSACSHLSNARIGGERKASQPIIRISWPKPLDTDFLMLNNECWSLLLLSLFVIHRHRQCQRKPPPEIDGHPILEGHPLYKATYKQTLRRLYYKAMPLD